MILITLNAGAVFILQFDAAFHLYCTQRCTVF